MTFRIRSFDKSADLAAVTQLLRSYAASLPIDLGYQNFDGELERLAAIYGPPDGSLLLAMSGSGGYTGCVGIRSLSIDGICELKRLFVRPESRGAGLGLALVLAAIEEAKKLGYREMRLDSLPSMETAIALYRKLGFSSIEPYYHPAPEGTVFLARQIS